MSFANDSNGMGNDNFIITIIKFVVGAIFTICTLGIPIIIKAIKSSKGNKS